MGKLSGRTALITGAGTGIGKKTAEVLAGHGASVVVTGYDGPQAAEVAAAIDADGGRATSLRVDVTAEDEIRGMVDHAMAWSGRVDILVNSAALMDPASRARDRDVCAGDAETWDRIMAVNLRGPMLTSKHAIPRMIESGGGAVINISSAISLFGEMTGTAYGVSKAGLNALTKYTATQYGKDRVRCNALPLGYILTDQGNEAKKALSPELSKIFLDNHLTPYPGSATNVADMIAFLASDEAAYITGQIIPVDGGISTHSPLYAQLGALFAASGQNAF